MWRFNTAVGDTTIYVRITLAVGEMLFLHPQSYVHSGSVIPT
jgi:hypothetical protein